MSSVADYDPLLDTVALAAWLGVKPSTVRSWAKRGKLQRRGRDRRGRALYSAMQASELAERNAAKAT